MANKGHISFGKQFLRAILGLFLSVGFGLFWVALIYGIERFLLLKILWLCKQFALIVQCSLQRRLC